MSLTIHEGGEKWFSEHGIGGYYYTGADEDYISDCRSLSRAEMLGLITMDVITNNLDLAILDRLVEGPWIIHANPTERSITYEGICTDDCAYKEDSSFYKYVVVFKPNLSEGIVIDYMFKEPEIEADLILSTSWSIKDISDMIGE